MVRPSCCASTVDPGATTTPRGAWWNSCAAIMVQSCCQGGVRVGVNGQAELLCFYSRPGGYNNATRCLVEQLRSHHGAKLLSRRCEGGSKWSGRVVVLLQSTRGLQQRHAVPGGTAAQPSWCKAAVKAV